MGLPSKYSSGGVPGGTLVVSQHAIDQYQSRIANRPAEEVHAQLVEIVLHGARLKTTSKQGNRQYCLNTPDGEVVAIVRSNEFRDYERRRRGGPLEDCGSVVTTCLRRDQVFRDGRDLEDPWEP